MLMELNLVENEPKYYEFIRKLRTHSKNKNGFLNNSKITKEEQILYMEKYNNSYFICLSGDTPIGYVGVVDNDLRICTHWDFKKNGVGTFMLSKIIEYYPNVDVKVLNSNKPSLNFFIKNKFKIINSDTNLSYLKYELQETK